MSYRVIKVKAHKCPTFPRGKTFKAKVDRQDFEALSKFSWVITISNRGKHFYATRLERQPDGTTKRIRMHRQLLGVTDPTQYVDHKDGDTLNNQRHNLRITTPAQNCHNCKAYGRHPEKNLSYQKKGIRVKVTANGETRTKWFPITREQEAIEQARQWRNEMHGEHTRQ